jgi:hypothetical protein
MTQRYAHLSPGYMAAAVNKLDGYLPVHCLSQSSDIRSNGDRVPLR